MQPLPDDAAQVDAARFGHDAAGRRGRESGRTRSGDAESGGGRAGGGLSSKAGEPHRWTDPPSRPAASSCVAFAFD